MSTTAFSSLSFPITDGIRAELTRSDKIVAGFDLSIHIKHFLNSPTLTINWDKVDSDSDKPHGLTGGNGRGPGDSLTVTADCGSTASRLIEAWVLSEFFGSSS